MLFSSLTFLYWFLPSVLILYFLLPDRFKNFVLLAASLLFYAWGEPRFIVLMLVTILSAYVHGRLIEATRGRLAERLWLLSSITIALAPLLYFKYANFLIDNLSVLTGTNLPVLKLSLPIGISFYTFQALSYTVDVYRGRIQAQRKLHLLALYITFFPQLIAGPIVRYTDIETALSRRSHSLENFSSGFTRFSLGLAKKVLLANELGEFVQVFRSSGQKSVAFYWLYAVAFSLQIYLDFSGYSDMAIGLGRIFGFDFPENFRYPFEARSITEFWRRWHISLGSWFRDYVYIPLGGNRVSGSRLALNLLTVWTLTGLWHGAEWQFVLWGLFFGLLLLFEKLLPVTGIAAPLRHAGVLVLVLLSFVIFNAGSLPELWLDVRSLFGVTALPWLSAETLYYTRSYGAVLLLGAAASTSGPRRLYEYLQQKTSPIHLPELVRVLIVPALLLLVTAYLLDGAYNPFLYFRF
ncbi:MAG: MBOAT family protein [Clostridiaceae bacterium]|nr:MBOAT family protein [Clostridiaceae bacterium]